MDDTTNAWICGNCAETNDAGFDACWNCGTHADGTPAAVEFVRDDAPAPTPHDRILSCLRCRGSMRFVGTRTYRQASLASATIIGEVAEMLVDQDVFDVYACSQCGKAEFFLS